MRDIGVRGGDLGFGRYRVLIRVSGGIGYRNVVFNMEGVLWRWGY